MPKPYCNEHSRETHISRLWQNLQKEPALPQLDRWLRQHFRLYKNYGKRDRRDYSDALFLGMRFLLLVAVAEAIAQGQTWPMLIKNTYTWQNLRQLPAAKVRAFSLWRQAQTTIPDWLAQLPPLQAACIWHSLPLQYAKALAVRMARSPNFSLEKFLQSQDQRPPLWLRPNHDPEASLTSLQKEGFAVYKHNVEIFDQKAIALRLDSQKSLQESEAFQSGLLEIQDLASQAIALGLAPKEGEMLWDACAGGGGKTLHLASLLGNSGAVYASDIRDYKALERRKRTRRAQFWNVRELSWQGQGQPTWPREIAKRQGFDGVLVDAPCSASGTWRRNPDAKYRFLYPQALDELTALQQQLLSEASQSVRPGGRLAYATCSWLVEENEAIAENFSEAHPDFTLQKMQLIGSPWQDSDTMFVATWLKK